MACTAQQNTSQWDEYIGKEIVQDYLQHELPNSRGGVNKVSHWIDVNPGMLNIHQKVWYLGSSSSNLSRSTAGVHSFPMHLRIASFAQNMAEKLVSPLVKFPIRAW